MRGVGSARRRVGSHTANHPLHFDARRQVSFSPDGRVIASASFDKTVKLWDGFTGKFIANLRGHVQRVYQV